MTQGEKVMRHLQTNRKLTSADAIVLYGITRLAAVVNTLGKQGKKIHTTYRKGVNKRATYAEYSLIHEVT